MQEDLEIFELANGLRVVHLSGTPGSIAHAALYVNAGTRDEKKELCGLAHMVEHTIFKGTKTRKGYHILNRIDSVGGELNAFTTKEETCIHTSSLEMHLERSLELLADLAFNSTFPEKELKKEKEVVLDEILSYEDSPSEQIYDDFEELLFQKHPLAMPILGKEKAIRALKRSDLIDFVGRFYTPKNLVLAIASGLSKPKLKKLVEKYFSAFPPGELYIRKAQKVEPLSGTKQIKRSISQAHIMLGGLAYTLHDKQRSAFALLNNILGGPAMNSLLNMNIRERHGIAYTIYSGFSPYADSGVWSIYVGTDAVNIPKTLTLVEKELESLRAKAISQRAVAQYKQQLMAQIALSQENRLSYLLALGKSMLTYNKVDTLEEIFTRIDAINPLQIQEIANEIFRPENTFRLILGKSKDAL